ncbi:MAG: molybdopterin-guanine dinucleotide biosynthesis protein MobB [Desulfurococcaceae archaeon]
MPVPYVVRFVSLGSGAGKTLVASRVVKELRARGFLVGVVKHGTGSVALEHKDTARYLESGAPVVLFSTRGLAVLYSTGHRDSLEDALALVKAPIVVVEGYKESGLGDAVLVAKSRSEVEELAKVVKNSIAVASPEPLEPPPGLPLFLFGEEERLAAFIQQRALEHLEKQLPGSNCGMCGFPTCRELAVAYARGSSEWCPLVSGARLIVDGAEVPLNPFVRNFVKSTIKGMLRALKGVPERPSKVVLVLEGD